MISKYSTIISLIALILVSSCASPLKKELISSKTPQFWGDVTPIAEPVQPTYKPTSMEIELLSINQVKSSLGEWRQFKKKNRVIREDMLALGYTHEQVITLLQSLYHDSVPRKKFKENISEINLIGDTRVAEAGELLTWDAKIKEIEINSKHIPLDQPILNCNVLMDRYGNIKSFDLSLPALVEADVRAKISEREYEELVKTIKYVVTITKVFSSTKVRSGDVLVRIDIRDLIRYLVKEIPESKWLYPITRQENLDYIVEGYTNFKGQKVLLASTSYVKEFDHRETDDRVRIEIYGYSLFDYRTFQILKQKQLNIVKFKNDKIGDFILKNITSYQSEQATQN
jgi:hypothetical protein